MHNANLPRARTSRGDRLFQLNSERPSESPVSQIPNDIQAESNLKCTVVDPTRVNLTVCPITTYLMVSTSISPNHGHWICGDGQLLAVSSLEAEPSFGPLLWSKDLALTFESSLIGQNLLRKGTAP